MKGLQRFSFSRFKAIVKKEIIQIRRDRASLGIALMMPILMLLLFGYVVNTDVDHIPMAVWDQERSAQSRELVQQLVNTEYYQFAYQAGSYNELQSLMDNGTVKVGLVIPPNYSSNLDTGRQAQVQLLVDGADPTTARNALANAELVVQNKSSTMQIDKLEKQGLGPIEMPLTLEPRVLYNPNMKSLMFNIPALIGLIMQNVTSILTAFTLVREKERGTMEQLVVTPIRPLELILGKLIPYVGVGLFSFSIVLLTGVFWFGVPVKGSILLLLVLSLLFLITTLAVGILISTISKTQLQAMQIAFAFILPSVLLSGFIFPRETMPLFVQWIGGAIPLTYFIEILRGIFLKGIGIDDLWRQTLTLSVFMVVICFIAILKFRKRMD